MRSGSCCKRPVQQLTVGDELINAFQRLGMFEMLACENIVAHNDMVASVWYSKVWSIPAEVQPDESPGKTYKRAQIMNSIAEVMRRVRRRLPARQNRCSSNRGLELNKSLGPLYRCLLGTLLFVPCFDIH